MTVDALAHLNDPERVSTIVLKIGSALLVDAQGEPREHWLSGLVDEVGDFQKRGIGVILVSSGAIALGAARLGLDNGGRGSLADAQAAASVGQIALAGLWSTALERNGLSAAQMLVTLGDLEDRRRYLNASSTLSRLLEAGVVPVVNENDSVATEEIRFGDNDRLAARVAQAAGADAVVLLSDVDGLYDGDPSDPHAKLVSRIEGVGPKVLAMGTSNSSSGKGTGGMASKLQAAQIAERAGITLAIINGKNVAPISTSITEDRGSLFIPRRSDGARRAWLGGRMAPSGSICVDDGCIAALAKGASLLAAGVTDVEGSFVRGALVSVLDSDGLAIAQGLVEYDADSCRSIAGLRQSEQAEILGHAPRSAVIHRDQMVML